MSVRAYRVVNDEVRQQHSFNCWQEDALFHFLLRGEGTKDGTTSEGVGTMHVPVKRLKEALDSRDLPMSNYARDQIKEDIASADDNLEESIEYECL